ncbi:MAG TPA: Fur family transcriptional regulator [Candidatus Saccharimonadales bacterium]|nr:Fur family transcriptional regulator [Candidatus Saccharimonadales bacterium]
MATPHETFQAMLRASGNSLTRARLRVFEALVGQEPLSMHQLVDAAEGADRASVYRAIDLFEQLGIVQRLNTGWKYRIELTDKFAEHHHHCTCTRCGKTVALNEEELERLVATLAARHGFTPTAHQIELQGICAQCQAPQAA